MWSIRSRSLFCKDDKSESLLKKLWLSEEQREWFVLIALYRRATMSEWLPSLFAKGHPWAYTVALSLTKNKQFAQKNEEQIPNPVVFLGHNMQASKILGDNIPFKLYRAIMLYMVPAFVCTYANIARPVQYVHNIIHIKRCHICRQRVETLKFMVKIH